MIHFLKIGLIVILIAGIALVGGFMFGGFSSFGKLPSEKDVEKHKLSPNFDAAKGVFVNRRPDILEAMKKRTQTFSNALKFLFNKYPDNVPDFELPSRKPDFQGLQTPSSDLKIIWLGHSSILTNFDGKIVLIDPVLADSTGPLGFMMKRFRHTVLEPKDLPHIDLVLITHDHYDHLDMETIRSFKNKDTRFIVPLGVDAHLRSWGIDETRIQVLDWWQGTEVEGLKITATPAQHFSGRSFTNQTKSLWVSWVVESQNHRIYFSGDSGYDTHFKEIGDKFGPFDIAFIESGQYNVLWPEVHLHPAESVQAFQDLKAKRYFPIHWGMFSLSTHAWYEPVEIISNEAEKKNIPLITPILGELVTVNDGYKPMYWWKEFINHK